MSSYLSFYIVPSRRTTSEPKRHLIILSYPKNSEICKAFTDNIQIVYAGNGEKYTTLTYDDIQSVIEDLSKSIEKTRNRLYEYEKYSSFSADYISEILDLKEYIKDLEEVKAKTSLLADMVDLPNYYGDSAIEELCCNID